MKPPRLQRRVIPEQKKQSTIFGSPRLGSWLSLFSISKIRLWLYLPALFMIYFSYMSSEGAKLIAYGQLGMDHSTQENLSIYNKKGISCSSPFPSSKYKSHTFTARWCTSFWVRSAVDSSACHWIHEQIYRDKNLTESKAVLTGRSPFQNKLLTIKIVEINDIEQKTNKKLETRIRQSRKTHNSSSVSNPYKVGQYKTSTANKIQFGRRHGDRDWTPPIISFHFECWQNNYCHCLNSEA